MRLFNISESNEQLILSKKRTSQLVLLAISVSWALLFGFVLVWCISDEPVDTFSIVIGAICSIYLCKALLQFLRQMLLVLNGETWVFDRENQVITMNGQVINSLDQIDSVRVWDDWDGKGLNSRLALQSTNGRVFTLSVGEAVTQEEWTDLVQAAKKISDFTNTKLVCV